MSDKETMFGESYVRIESDEMTAWLYLDEPAPPKVYYTKNEIVEFMIQNGVAKGFHQSNIAAMSKKRIHGREIKVAVGFKERDGKDGYFDYRFTPDTIRAPKVLPDGSVDYTSMSMLQNVHEGDVLAIYHHSVKGEDGYNVRGKVLPAKVGRDLPPMRGRNINNNENQDVYVAEIDGKVEVKNGRVDIQSVHEIIGTVGLITGRVEFLGDVIINGSVEAGVVIKAERNIIIKGSVEAVNMEAGGDIILERGIQGGQKAKLVAKGNVFADFIEHATVEADGDVHANIIMNSNVSSGGKVVLTGKKGSLIGGFTHALKGIEVTNLGNRAEVRTIVHVGYEPNVYDQYLMIMHGDGETEPSDEEKEEIYVQILEGKGSEVVVDGPVYRGVVVGVNDARIPIEHNTCYMKYRYKNGTVDGTVIIK